MEVITKEARWLEYVAVSIIKTFVNYLSNITRVVRSRRMNRTENLKGSGFCGDIGEYGRIILTGSVSSRLCGCGCGCCKHGNATPCSMKSGKFLDKLSDHELT